MGKCTQFSLFFLHKSHPHRFYVFCPGLSQIGSKWPVFVLGFNHFFLPKNSLWCHTEQTSLSLSSHEREGGDRGGDSISRKSLTIFVNSTIISFASLPASGGSQLSKTKRRSWPSHKSVYLKVHTTSINEERQLKRCAVRLIKVTTISCIFYRTSPLKIPLLFLKVQLVTTWSRAYYN